MNIFENNEVKVAVPSEFSFAENIKYLSRSSDECLFRIDDNKISKLIMTDQETTLIEVSGSEEGFITLRFLGHTSLPSSNIVDEAASYIKDWFDLDTDLAPFYEKAQQDALLNKVISRFYGLRNIGIPDLFEALCWGIIGQQINLAFAYTLKKRFVEAFGQSVTWNDRDYWVFPSPNVVAKLTVSDLTDLKMTSKKAEYLIGVAQLIADGKLSKALLLRAKDYATAEKQLVSIRGIGPWTANYVLMRCLRFPSAFPIDDIGLHNAIKHLLEMDRKPTIAEIKQLASQWTNWESYATFYLWRCLY